MNDPTLPDILRPGLDLVFAGINPSIYSAQRGHYFARPSNRFWPVLSASGLVPEPLRPEDDVRLPDFGIGLTDVVKRATPSAADLTPAELIAGAVLLRDKILHFAPRAVCFVGKIGFQAFSGCRNVAFGRQDAAIGDTALFVMPSTSGRANRLHAERVACLAELRRFLGR